MLISSPPALSASMGPWSSLLSLRQYSSGAQMYRNRRAAPTEFQRVPSNGSAGADSNINPNERRSTSVPRQAPSVKESSSPLISKLQPDASRRVKGKLRVSYPAADSTRKLSFQAANSGDPAKEKWSRLCTEPRDDNPYVSRSNIYLRAEMLKIRSPSLPFDSQMLEQLVCHILVYAELLWSWHLPRKRLELLNFVYRQVSSSLASTLPPFSREHEIRACF